MVPAILTALLGAAGSIGNTVYNSYQADKQRKWEEKQSDIAYQRSLDVWNMTNAYNDPGKQLERMRNAGLNTLYFGLDGSSAGAFQAEMANNYERSNVNGLQNPFSEAARLFNDTKLNAARIENINADTANKAQLTLSEVERRQNLIAQRDEIKQRANMFKSSADVNEKMAAKIEQFMQYADDIYQSQINRDQSVADLNNQQRERIAELLEGEKELQRLSIEDYAHKWQRWKAEINHLAKGDKLLEKQATYYLLTLLQSGVYGSGASAVNGLLFNYIASDPDLNDEEKEQIKKILVPEKDKKRKYKPVTESIADAAEPLSDMADPYTGGYFGATF